MVGDITTMLNINATAVRTAFGGNDEAPIAERTSESTTTIRMNAVVVTTRNGSRAIRDKPRMTSKGKPECASRRPPTRALGMQLPRLTIRGVDRGTFN